MSSLIFSILFFTVILYTNRAESKVLSTSYGKLEGETHWSDDHNHKYIFRGIPMAKPPLGNLRFALPEDPEPWEGTRDASKYSTACLGNWTNTKYRKEKVSEDCLYINVFTNEKCLKKQCAVIVYYHGGGFTAGAAIMFSDDFILERYVAEDVVFAVPAFRVGALGQLFFGPNDIFHENILMFDAVQGLKYVNKEIQNFGGDPTRVTIMGHSTGAFMVNALGFSNLIDPDTVLFQQMIVLSAPMEFGFTEFTMKSSFELADRLNCTINNHNNTNLSFPQVLQCLRNVDSYRFLQVQSDMIRENGLNFRGILRGAPMMKLEEKIADFKKNTPPRNILYGTTEFEFQISNKGRGPHAAGSFMDFENPISVIRHYYGDFPQHENEWTEMDSAGVYTAARTYCEAMVKAGGTVYLFETRQKPESTHTTDMQYSIGIHFEKVHTPDMDVLDSFYSKLLTNFTKTGVPSPLWKKLNPKKMNYVELKVDLERNEGPIMLENYHDKEMKVWFGEMIEYDRNVTKEKLKNAGQQVSNEEYSIFEQWWFYVVVFLIFVVLIITCIICVKICKSEERTPLLM